MKDRHTTIRSRRAFLKGTLAISIGISGASALSGNDFAAAAGGFPATYPAMNPQLANESATLNVWLAPELAEQPAYKMAIRLFGKAYPKLKVVVTPINKDDIPARLKIAIAGNAAPDLVSHHAYIFGAQGLAQESDALWDAWGMEPLFLVSAMRDVRWRSDKFGIPLAGNAILTIINTDMFAKANVPLPTQHTTFAQFTAAIAAVKQATHSPFGMLLAGDAATVTAVVHANGGALYHTVAGRNIADLATSRVVEAVRFYTELGWKHRLSPLPPNGPTNPTYLAEQFIARRAPVFFGTTSDLALIQAGDPNLKVALAPLPGGTTGKTTGSVNNGYSLFVPVPGRRKHAAFELAKWMVAPAPALSVATALRLAPTVKLYYGNPFFDRDAATSVYFRVAEGATPIGLDAYTEAFDMYTGALRSAFGGQDAGKLLAAIQASAQASMDKADAGIESDG